MTYDQLDAEWHNTEETMLCHTSGSTGSPKQVLLTKKFMLESAARTAAFFSLNAQSKLHSCISADFIGGKMMYVRSQLLGCSFSWETPTNRPLDCFSPSDTFTMVSVVPSQLLHILENSAQMPKVDIYLVGGSPLPKSMVCKIIKSRINVYESYGMTETASHIAVRKVEEDNPGFIPLPGIKISTKEGCLEVQMPNGLKLLTNDLVEIDSTGGFRIIGRKDNIIISGGKKINPEEVERILQNAITNQIMISSRPDDKWGEKVVCLIEKQSRDIEDQRNEITEEHIIPAEDKEKKKLISSIKLFAESRLEGYLRPKEYIIVNKLPRTPSGKLRRK